MRKIANTIVIFLVLCITIGSFTLSFNALMDFAIKSGTPDNLAWIWPLLVDLTIVVCTLVVLMSELNKWPVRYPVILVIIYGFVTVFGNLWHAQKSLPGWFVGLVPPATLIALTELLRVLVKNTLDKPKTLTVQDETPAVAVMSPQDIRRDKVKTMVETGIDIQDIAKELAVSIKTVQRDIKSWNGQLQ